MIDLLKMTIVLIAPDKSQMFLRAPRCTKTKLLYKSLAVKNVELGSVLLYSHYCNTEQQQHR